MECRADVTGNSLTIGKFLDNLEADPLGIRLQSLELTSRDDNGQQLSLGLELNGLLLPATQPMNRNILIFFCWCPSEPAGLAVAQDTNSAAAPARMSLQTLMQKNIFDPTRSGRVGSRSRLRAAAVRAFTFRGSDGYVAFFTGEGTPGKGMSSLAI